jgi:hypothetical protein
LFALRRVAFRVLAALFFLLLLVPFGLELPLLLVWWLPDSAVLAIAPFFEPAELAHRIHHMTLSVLAWATVLAVGVQLRRPERRVAPLLQALAFAVAITLVELGTGTFSVDDSAPFLVPLLLLALLHPRARELVGVPRLDRAMTGLTAVAVIPWTVFAAGQAELQRLNVAGDPHAQLHHWNLMTAFAVLVVLWALIGSTDRPGWRLTAWIAGLASAVYGLQSLFFSDLASAAPAAGGIAALAWGVAYLVVAERRVPLSEPATACWTSP